jgi:hypothetical protein
MSKRLFKASREEGLNYTSVTVLPKAPSNIDAHAEAVLEGVLHAQTQITQVVQRHFKHFHPHQLIAREEGAYKGAKPYGKSSTASMAKRALPKPFEALVDVPSLD